VIDRDRTGRVGVATRTLGRGVLPLVLCAVVALVAPAAALAATQTAHKGNVTATYSYRGSFPNYNHEKLTITRGNTVAYSAPVTASMCGGSCVPGAPSGTSVHVLDLEHNGRLDVVLDLFSGGAHCCAIEQIFAYDAAKKAYVKAKSRNFGDPGDMIVDLRHNGRYEFLTADDRFAYAFTGFAASGLPVRVLTFSAGHFHNVTRNYPKLVAKDATIWLKAYKNTASNGYQESEGVIAAWAADEELLGHSTLVNQYLSQEAKAGHLHGDTVNGQKFVTALKQFLRKLGYIR
jgi:hypothetical protein